MRVFFPVYHPFVPAAAPTQQRQRDSRRHCAHLAERSAGVRVTREAPTAAAIAAADLNGTNADQPFSLPFVLGQRNGTTTWARQANTQQQQQGYFFLVHPPVEQVAHNVCVLFCLGGRVLRHIGGRVGEARSVVGKGTEHCLLLVASRCMERAGAAWLRHRRG